MDILRRIVRCSRDASAWAALQLTKKYLILQPPDTSHSSICVLLATSKIVLQFGTLSLELAGDKKARCLSLDLLMPAKPNYSQNHAVAYTV